MHHFILEDCSISVSAIKAVKRIPNRSCALTLRYLPKTERSDACPRPALSRARSSPPPLTLLLINPSCVFQDAPDPAACSFVQPVGLLHTQKGTGEATDGASLLSGGPFPCNSRYETGSPAPPPQSLVPTPPKLHSAPAAAEMRRRISGKPQLPGAPAPPARPLPRPPGDTKRRARRQPARERPGRRDPLTETWPRFKA